MSLTKEIMFKALKALEAKLTKKLSFIVGGGGALILNDRFPLATSDIDAIPKGMTIDEVSTLVKEVALELSIAGDWLNPWFASFTHVLPEDFESRLITVYQGPNLIVKVLSDEDLLIMKCFAHRAKDISHARVLIRKGANLDLVFKQIEHLNRKKIPNSKEALDFLEEMIALEEG